MSLHAGDDVADPAPVVEASVQEPELWGARLEGEEAKGGAVWAVVLGGIVGLFVEGRRT